jgi:hypothetical protein
MKNGIKYLVAGLVATGLTASSSFAVINAFWGAASSSYVTDNTGAANYLTGDLVELGTFATTPTVGSSSLAGFTVFGTDLTAAGGWAASSGPASDVGFAHTQEYLVVFNAATQGAATQEAIVYVNDTQNSSWRFAASSDTPNNSVWDLDTLFSGTSGSVGAGGVIVYGSTAQDGSGPYNMLETKLIPEPSSVVLVVTGLLGLLGLRRRS